MRKKRWGSIPQHPSCYAGCVWMTEKQRFQFPQKKDNIMATAAENLVILQRILDGIRDNKLNDVMSELGFEVTKSTDKSTEWSLAETSKNDIVPEEEKVYNQPMFVRYNDEPYGRIMRFANTDKENDFIQYVRDNANKGVVSIETIHKDENQRIVYK